MALKSQILRCSRVSVSLMDGLCFPVAVRSPRSDVLRLALQDAWFVRSVGPEKIKPIWADVVMEELRLKRRSTPRLRQEQFKFSLNAP